MYDIIVSKHDSIEKTEYDNQKKKEETIGVLYGVKKTN